MSSFHGLPNFGKHTTKSLSFDAACLTVVLSLLYQLHTLTSAGLDDLRRELGLRSPNFRGIRLSVQRPNVCTTITELTHRSNGD
jgi:hypothetical protein